MLITNRSAALENFLTVVTEHLKWYKLDPILKHHHINMNKRTYEVKVHACR